jgi:uncharacterized protein (TIGR02145 family)
MKNLLTLLLVLTTVVTGFSQSNIPQLVSFSAIVRDANNQALVNTPVSVRLTFKQGGQTGPLVYCALHQTTTNQNGFMSLQLNRNVLGTGCNGAPSTAFQNIPWENGSFWMEVEYQTVPSTPFVSLGQLELASSFYAFAAGTAERINGFDLSGANNGDVLTYNITTGQWEATAPNSGMNNGTANNQILYWNGTNWVTLNPGSVGQVLTLCNNGLAWTTSGQCPGSIQSLNCSGATNTGTLTSGTAASGVSSSVPYTGNGGTHNGQTVSSTGVTGLTATLTAGTFANGSGSLTYTITGTPGSSGTASFALNIGGQTCVLTITVAAQSQYPAGSVFCASGPTAVVDVTNPSTGKIWMDRNLGASQVATSSSDANAYGDLYQWGRRADGHQCRTSPTTATLSSTDQPAHGDFIFAPNSPNDWRSPQNTNLWQGVNGINNPCPSGYRLPTDAELEAERLSWSQNNSIGAFASPLKLSLAGARDISGSFLSVGSGSCYSSSTVSSYESLYLNFYIVGAGMQIYNRAHGCTVRCLKD